MAAAISKWPASRCACGLPTGCRSHKAEGRQLEKVIATTLLSRRPIRGDDERGRRTSDEPAWSGDLAACREIVQAHGGSLEVERAADGVFRFHMQLPATAAGAGPAAPAS